MCLTFEPIHWPHSWSILATSLGGWAPGTVPNVSQCEFASHALFRMLPVLLCVGTHIVHKLKTWLALWGQDLWNLDTGSISYVNPGPPNWGSRWVFCSNSETCPLGFYISIPIRFLSKNYNLLLSLGESMTNGKQFCHHLLDLFPSRYGQATRMVCVYL